MTHDQQSINKFFKETWNPNHNPYQYGNPEVIASKIQDDEWVLDVGCGQNIFKRFLKNVVGVDPAFEQADVVCTIEEFQPDRQFDVAVCLGSVIFGTKETISNQVDKIVSCLKPHSRIYWRVNPRTDDHINLNRQNYNINIFPWTHELLKTYAVKHGFEQINEQHDSNGVITRLYAEWVR